MKKVITLLIITSITIIGIYYHYDRKTENVFLSGKVIGFNLTNIKDVADGNESDMVKTSSKSVGTITFIKRDNSNFAALGHSISGEKENINLQGNCYEIEFDYIKKAKQNKTGKIIAEIKEENKIGEINNSNQYGIYGKITDAEKEMVSIDTGNRLNIKNGIAYILINLDGQGLKKYEVEITEINYFAATQNIRIKVKSQELINLSGGIVQGMSGAPLIQNDKLIGAINCVNINNSLDAYAIFIDKLL